MGTSVAGEFRGFVNLVNLSVHNGFFRELIRFASEPNDLATAWHVHGSCFAQGNRPAPEFQNQHGPLIFVKAAQMRDIVVGELADCKGIASDGLGGEC